MGLVVFARPETNGGAALLGEFHGIADQIDQDLAESGFIALDETREIRIDVEKEPQTLLSGTDLHHVDHVAHHVAQIERRDLQLQFPASILAISSTSLISLEQMLAAVVLMIPTMS